MSNIWDGWEPGRKTTVKDEYGMSVVLKRVQRHRNGVSGVGFYTVEFDWTDEEGVIRNMVGWVHDAWTDDGECVPDGATSAKGVDVPYGVIDRNAPNMTWRGDHFSAVMEEAIKRYNRARARAR